MKHLKLFFALFAMLALGVGNAWGADCDYSDDFSTVRVNTSYSTRTTTAGWKATYTAVEDYTYNSNSYRAFKMNGKKGGLGKITSPLFSDGCSAISFVYGQAHKDAIKFDVKIYDKNNVELFSKSYSASKPSAAPTAGVLVEETITGVEGDFYVVFANTSTSTSTSNGYRVSIMNVCITSSGSGTEETVVSVPTFSVPECTFYSSSLDVELSCATDGATIHYTIDGTTPSKTSPTYSGAIAINNTTTIKAFAVKDGLTDSEVATANYTKGETVTSYDIDFETNALEAYVNWDFSNITIAKTVTAKKGTYYGNTSGKASASIKTKEQIQYPGTLTFSVSKETNNETSSSWKVQVSENGSTWTDVKTLSATEMSKGVWKDHSVDLSDYENVYVQISYVGTTAVRAIDEISLAQGVAPEKYTLTIVSPENGTLSVTEGGVSVASGDEFKAGTSLVVTPAPATGYVFESLTVDGTEVELSEGKYTFTMPEKDVTISATFKANEKPAATLTLSKNGETELLPGDYKQDDVVTLPDFESDCSKTFVGWSENPNCNSEPEYKAGDSYQLKLEGNQTLYAVYADGEEGGVVTIKHNVPSTETSTNMTGNNDAEKFFGLDVNDWSIVSAKNGASNHIGVNKDGTLRLYYHANGGSTLTITAPKDIASIVLNCNSSYKNAWVKVNGSPVTPVDGVYSINAKTVVIGNANTENKQVYVQSIEVTLAGELSNYSTTCAAAPKAEVTPTEVTATAAGVVEGKMAVTYENVNTENVAIALFNDEACTETFTAGWLTAAIDVDENISYSVAENTTYAERKAYIRLTAPETTGATDPVVVVIPVTQAAKEKVFASLEALLAAITPTTEGVEVTVTLTNEVIQDFYTSGSYRNGIALNVPYQGGVKVIEIYCKDVPAEWVKGGKVSGTITCPWKLYNSTWELCPTAWTELTYTAPATVKSIAVSGTPTKTTYVDGEAFDPTGLVVTATLTDDSTEPIDVALVDWTFDPETLSKGETSVSVVATYNTMASAAYEVTGLTVNDIPTKTVAEFIEAGGTRCYLEGIVSGLTEGNSMKYGNFDLTDASGTIYVYGCLNAAGESQKFADLGVKNGDKIKVIADDYELYGGTKDEAKNVQYVSHVSAASITIANITMEVGETKTIAATVVPAEAEVTYTIKEDAANAISLSGNTITALAEGTATITATVAEGATYLGNSVDFTVTVGPKTEKVVILAQYEGQWYALKAEYLSGKTDRLVAVPVDYFNGSLYNVEEEIKATIEWNSIVEGDKVSFLNDGKYLKGKTSTTLIFEAGEEGLYQWDKDTYTMTINGTVRSFLYNGEAFRNFAISNAGQTKDDITYSSFPVVTAPVYATGNPVYTRTVTNKYGTICLPYASASTSGAYFYEVVGKGTENGKPAVYLASVDALEAGVPYIFEKTANTITVTCQGEAIAEAGSANGLVGNFTNEFIVPADNYILYNNAFIPADGTTNKVNAYRAYLNMNDVTGGAPVQMPGRRYIGMSVQGENEATGFDNIQLPNANSQKLIINGQLIIIRDGIKYNAQGQKL